MVLVIMAAVFTRRLVTPRVSSRGKSRDDMENENTTPVATLRDPVDQGWGGTQTMRGD